MTVQNTGRRRVIADTSSLLLFAAAVGAGLCLVFLSRSYDWTAFTVAVSILVGLRLAADRLRERRTRLGRLTPWAAAAAVAARAGLFAFYVLAVYLAVAWGGVLWWATSWRIRVLIALLLAAWVATRFTRRAVPRIPLSLPLGIWIVACLTGWLREESFLRCDDYARLRPPVSLLLATTTDVARCRSGESLPIDRYPRKFWQSPDGRWLRFTSQSGVEYHHPTGRLDGIICELDLESEGAMEPRCVGGVPGKSHGIVGAEAIGKVFVAAWSLPPDDQGRTSAVFTLPEEGPLRIESEHRFDGSVADLIFEPKSGTMHLFCDENDRVRTATLPGFRRQPDSMEAVFPGTVRYDADRHEGVICSWLAGAAVRADPLSIRFFGRQAPSPWSVLAISWGCDWDPVARRVYTAVPNLGFLYEIDYDSGQILRKHWIGFGMRGVTLDRRRGLVYVTDFLGGYVRAIDTATGEERARWFVGRFPREAYLSRDGDSLFVGSTLGVVRIQLDPTR